MKAAKPTVICSIGSVDPTGAAGLTNDLRVYACLKAAGVAVVAAVTAQNSSRVASVAPLSGRVVRQQLELVWEQVRPDAVCIGLLPEAALIRTVRRFLSGLAQRPPLVIDPVLAASSGRRFLGAREIRELVLLLPLATVVTPNLHEAAALTSSRVTTIAQAEAAARMLSSCGCAALVTGGHLAGSRCIDILSHRNRVRRFAAQRITGTMRGAGGILAAALAVGLARGITLDRAIVEARSFVRRAHRHARALGSGKRQFIAG